MEYSSIQAGMPQYVSRFKTIIILLPLYFEIHDNTTQCKPVPNDTGIVPAAQALKEIISSVEK
jgi:hypothetical protein